MLKKWMTIILLLGILLAAVIAYKAGAIEISSFILMLAGSITFIVLNIVELKKVKEAEYKKLLQKSEYLVKKKEFQNAIRLYDESLRLLPHHVDALLGKAQCYRMLTQYQKALDCCRIAQETDTTNFMSYYIAGMIYLQMNNPDDALISFLAVESKNPNYAETYNYIGKIYEKMGRGQEALIYYQKFQSKGGLRKQLYWKKTPGN
jgi:tetratricopeptide (TPR) repeat protein